MNKSLFALLGIWLAVSGCNSSDSEIPCYHGNVIMSSCCSGTTFIELDSAFPIGKATQLNGRSYQNVIQVPGYLASGEIYLNLRAFDQEKDHSLYPTPICYCLIGVGMDVPLWVQTGYSYNSCPPKSKYSR